MRSSLFFVLFVLSAFGVHSQTLSLEELRTVSKLPYDDAESFLVRKGFKLEKVQSDGGKMIVHPFTVSNFEFNATEYVSIIVATDENIGFKMKIAYACPDSRAFESYKRTLISLNNTQFKSERMQGKSYHRVYRQEETEFDFVLGEEPVSKKTMYCIYLKNMQ